MADDVIIGGTVYPAVRNATYSEKEMCFGKTLVLSVGRAYYQPSQIKLFQELMQNFTAGICRLKVTLYESKIPTAVLAEEAYAPSKSEALGDDDYAIRIDGKRAELYFHDNKSLAHAFCTVLSLIEIRETKKGAEKFTLPVGRITDKPVMHFRSAHLCVFAESTFERIRKKIREIGFLKYSHLVLEFWGTFPYACNRSLYRKGAFSKKQVKTLIAEANALGLEVIPMLNIWGHAANNRAKYGKHTVLDQNPKMQPYFNKTGWVWNILKPEVKRLQRQMMEELMEACGESEFFHIGCDEAVTYGEDRAYNGKDRTKIIYNYVNETAAWLKTKGRKTMMWGDMLLCNPEWQGVTQYGESPEIARRICENLDKDIFVVDWQYTTQQKDIPTTKFLSDFGFKTLLAPFNNPVTLKICADNVVRYGYYGFMLTTWHLVSAELAIITRGAIACWTGAEQSLEEFEGKINAVIGDYLRKLMPPKGKYEVSGITPTKRRYLKPRIVPSFPSGATAR